MRAYEQIEAILRAKLLDGSLPPGTVLLEGPLAEIFGSSRSPVKQALDQMKADGLLSRFDGRGLVVGDGTAPIRRVALGPSLLGSDSAEVQRVWGWQRLYGDVERDLVRCSVLGCFRVNEVELASHYRIGRTVARDVLIRIEAAGIIEKTERGHWLTVPLDDRRVRHLYDLRRLLEPAALVEAASVLPRDLVVGMLQRLEVVAETYPVATGPALDRLETDLHVTCLGHAENREMLEALRRTHCILLSSKHLLGSATALPTDDPFLEEHRTVLTALVTGRAATAGAALAGHLESACDKVLRRLQLYRVRAGEPELSYVVRAQHHRQVARMRQPDEPAREVRPAEHPSPDR